MKTLASEGDIRDAVKAATQRGRDPESRLTFLRFVHMNYLHSLIADHIRDLSGAEFKIAAYCYRRLERQKQVSENIKAIATATGLSWRQTQTALRKLNQKGVLQVDSVKHRGTCCRLPDAVPARKRRAAVSRKSLQTPAEAVPPTTSPTEEHTAQAIPSAPDVSLVQKQEQVQQLVRELMGTRYEIMPRQFSELLQCADGDIDRLLHRLQVILKENKAVGNTLDNFTLLCSVVRSQVLVQ